MERQLHITLVNEDLETIFSDWRESLSAGWLTEDATNGEIYRACQKEFGRCTSKVYIERRIRTDTGAERWENTPIGWYFVSRQQYEDTGEPYLRGAWVIIEEKGD